MGARVDVVGGREGSVTVVASALRTSRACGQGQRRQGRRHVWGGVCGEGRKKILVAMVREGGGAVAGKVGLAPTHACLLPCAGYCHALF